MGDAFNAFRNNILSTKLLVPTRSEVNIVRPRLLDRLAKGQHRKLTLISAPAGFGKTTLLSEWVQHGDSQFAWLTLDETDNDPVHFFSYIISAFRTIESQVLVGADALIAAPETFSVESSLTVLINAITNYSKPLALILDDYHLIRADEAHRMVDFLLNHLPQNLHLVIATRADPPLPVALLRSRMQLNELRAADLRFTEEETTAFLKKLIDEELTPENITSLTARTEGWIAGLQMIALSMQGKKDFSEYLDSLAGTHVFISDYLTNEVLEQQPEQIQSFLLKTAILELLTGSLCDAVLGIDGSESILQELYAKNLFLTIVDGSKPWYRYHPLFADVLSHRLKQEYADTYFELHRRASLWFEENLHVNEAIEHALRAEDFEKASGLINKVADAVFLRGENDTILSWIRELPEEVVGKQMTLSIFRAMAEILNGVPEGEVSRRLRGITELSGQQPLPSEIWVVRALKASYLGNTARSVECCRRAVELLPGDKNHFRGFVVGNLGRAYLYHGDVARATAALHEALRMSQGAGDKLNILIVKTWLGDTFYLEGKLEEAKACYDQALRIGAGINGTPPPVIGRVMASLGRLYIEWNDLEKAENLLDAGMRLSRRLGITGTISAQLSRLALFQLCGEFDLAEEILTGVGDIFDQMDFAKPEITPVDLCRVRLYLARGEPERALAWANDWVCRTDEAGFPLNRLEAQALLAVAQVRIRYAIKFETRLHEDVILMLKSLVLSSKKARWGLIEREALVYLAIANELAGQHANALRVFQRALRLSVCERHVRIFLQEGEVLRSLLYKALEKKYTPAFASRLLLTIENRIMGAGLDFPAMTQTLENETYPPELSDREIEVLLLLEAGCSNKEVAERLCIALSTVKAHLYNIYQKFGVHSRTQALAKAHAYGIISTDAVP